MRTPAIRTAFALAALACLLPALAPRSARCETPPRPSILLIVVDTLRADAVSAYGAVKGTTPHLDALASEGLLYENAWASAPWTLPSHATIFTGVGFAVHRVGMPGQGSLPESFDTLAERLRAAGYETAAFSENSLVVDEFHLLQGFDHKVVTALTPVGSVEEIDAAAEIGRWLDKRKPGRPYFVFVNLMDPHQPYKIRPENPFVPKDVPKSEVLARSEHPNRLLCGGLPSPQGIAALHGLYLGDVQDADTKIDRIVRDLRERGGAEHMITLVTSDHGESFGERKLLGHEFTMHNAVLKVPLVLHGAPGAATGRVATTVGLIDVAPTLLHFAGIEPGKAIGGVPLPLAPSDTPGDRVLFAGFSDAPSWLPEKWLKNGTPFTRDESRQFCSQKDHVWGGMAAVIQYPFKLEWYERYPTELYDLSWDQTERMNVAGHQPEVVKKLKAELQGQLTASGLAAGSKPPPSEGTGLSPEARKALEALGYISR